VKIFGLPNNLKQLESKNLTIKKSFNEHNYQSEIKKKPQLQIPVYQKFTKALTSRQSASGPN